MATAQQLPLSKVGIDPEVRRLLKTNKICTIEAYLERRSRFESLSKFAVNLKIPLEDLLIADGRIELSSIHGVGQLFLELLMMAKVTSVFLLSKQKPESLHKSIVAINKEKRVCRRSPNIEEVNMWIRASRTIQSLPQ